MSNQRPGVSGPIRGLVVAMALMVLAALAFFGCQAMGGVPDLG